MRELSELMETVGIITRTLFQKAAPLMTGTEVVACECAAMEWEPGAYAVNDVRTYAGQIWRCCQSHDSTGNPDWEPGAVPALWAPYHTMDPARAKPYLAPTGAQDAYQAGECILWTDGAVYRCLADAAVHSPGELPGAWEKI